MCNVQIIMSLTCHCDKHGMITILKKLLDGVQTCTNTLQQELFICLYEDVAILYLVTPPPLSSPTLCVCVCVCVCAGVDAENFD